MVRHVVSPFDLSQSLLVGGGLLVCVLYHCGYLGREDLFCTVLLCILATFFLISSASVRSIPFLSFIEPIFA